MDDYHYLEYLEYDQSFTISNPESRTMAVGSYTEGEYEVNFDFVLDSIIKNWAFRQGYVRPQLESETRHNNIDIKSVRVKLSRTYKEFVEIVKEGLGDFLVPDDKRDDLVSFAIETALNLISTTRSKCHNVFNIYVRVLEVDTHLLLDRRVMDSMIRRPIEETNVMIPASDSSIQSLEIKKLDLHEDESKSCSICMEDFSKGCEVACMPCSHVFHENCIKKWLKTGHHCPSCRFEMPTN